MCSAFAAEHWAVWSSWRRHRLWAFSASSSEALCRWDLVLLPICIGWLPICVGWLPICVDWLPICVGWLPICIGWLPICIGWLPVCVGWLSRRGSSPVSVSLAYSSSYCNSTMSISLLSCWHDMCALLSSSKTASDWAYALWNSGSHNLDNVFESCV